MTPLKQTLCRHLASVAARLGTLLLLCVLHAVWGTAMATPAPRSASGPEAVLTQSVQQWVSRQQGGRPEQVQLMPLDPRVRVQDCPRPLVMDWPFASQETLRVRCPEPAWQLYVRLVPTGRSSVSAQDGRKPVVVAGQTLVRGMTVQPGDVRLQEVSVPAGTTGYLEQVAEALHSEVLRDVPAGTPLRRMDIRQLVLIKRGQIVQLSVGKSSGFVVSARVEAMQDGRMGEQIKFKNPESGRILTGVVKGPNEAEAL